MQVRPLGLEDPLKEGTATPSSILAWRIPWTEAPGRLSVDNLESQITFVLKYYFPSVLIFARFFLPLVTKSKVLHPFRLLK